MTVLWSCSSNTYYVMLVTSLKPRNSFAWPNLNFCEVQTLDHRMTPPSSYLLYSCLILVLHLSWNCLVFVLRSSCICLEVVLHLSWSCNVFVLKLSCTCLTFVLKLSCIYLEVVLYLSWSCLEVFKLLISSLLCLNYFSGQQKSKEKRRRITNQIDKWVLMRHFHHTNSSARLNKWY